MLESQRRNRGPAGRQTHLLNEVLPVGADVVHAILVDGEVCLESFVLLQQALREGRQRSADERQPTGRVRSPEGAGPASG